MDKIELNKLIESTLDLAFGEMKLVVMQQHAQALDRMDEKLQELKRKIGGTHGE